jgi:hypothetical protein
MGKWSLSGAIPGDNNDGLGQHSKDLVEQPLRLVNVVARVAVSKVITNTETGVTYPVVKIHHIEAVPAEHQEMFGKMIGDAFGARTGAQELPFPEDWVPMKDPFPEEEAEAARQAVEDLADEEAGDDELAAPRGARARAKAGAE